MFGGNPFPLDAFGTCRAAHVLVTRWCLLLGVFALATLAPMNSLRAQTVSFGGQTVGSSPADFEISRTGNGAPARWIIVRDETADGGIALEQASQDTADYRFPLAIYKAFDGVNVDVQTRFKPMSGKLDQSGGIAVRLASPDDYYIVRANALEDNVRFYRVVKGRRQLLKSASVKVAPKEWHTLALKAEGDRFTVTFDGTALYTVADKTLSKAGKVALWTKSDSVTRFDRLEIKALP